MSQAQRQHGFLPDCKGHVVRLGGGNQAALCSTWHIIMH